MVGTQTNLDGGFGISKKSSFSDKEAVPQKNLLTSSRLLSSLCLLCCNDLRQFDFTCVCLSKYTACWAGQLPSDAWDCFMTEDGKISMVFISPSKPCPQMVLHVWDRTGSLHCSSSSSSATTNTRFYLSTQWHSYGDALNSTFASTSDSLSRFFTCASLLNWQEEAQESIRVPISGSHDSLDCQKTRREEIPE